MKKAKKLKPSLVIRTKEKPQVALYDPSIPPDISLWFELSYARFLTIPRLVLESMPLEWQQKMAALLFEMDETFDWRPKEGRYWVRLKDSRGRFTAAPLSNYRRGQIEIESLRINKAKKFELSYPSDARAIAGKVFKWYRKWINHVIVDKSTKWAMSSELLDILGKTLPPLKHDVMIKNTQWSKKQIKHLLSLKRVPISFNSISVKGLEKTSRISPAMRGRSPMTNDHSPEIRGI